MNEEVSTSRLTNWENEPSILDLKNDLNMSKISHDTQIGKINHWKDILNITGSAKPKKKRGRSSIQPRLIKRQAEWRYAALSEPFLSSNKIFSVYPRTFEDSASAKQNELVLNYQFDTKLNKVKFIDDVIHTVVDEGTCIVRVGWDRQTTTVIEQVPIYNYIDSQDPTYIQTLTQALQLRTSNPRQYKEKVDSSIQKAIEIYLSTNAIVQAIPIGYQDVEVEKVLVNKPVAEVVNTSNVYIDPTCNGDFSKALFVITSFETCIAELAKDGRYVNLDKINLDNSNIYSDTFHTPTNFDENFRFKDDARKKIVAYEYWGFYDIHGNNSLVPIVATWVNETLIRLEENPYPDGKLPFVIIPYTPVVRSVYGEPDGALLEENQAIIGAITRGMIDLLGRSANSQLGIAKGMLDAVNEERFKRGEDYQFNPNMNPANGYIEHRFPEVPQSAMVLIQQQNQEAEGISGVKSYSTGVSGETYGKVATAARGAIDAASKREMAILRRVAKGISEIGEKFIAMNAIFLEEEEVIRVTNREFIPINREDLKGNFDLIVDISTAAIDDQKAQDLGFMLQTIGPNLDTQIMLGILAEIADLKRMPELAEKLRTYQPQPSPMDELLMQEQQLKNQKLESEVNLNTAKTANTEANTAATDLGTQQEASGIKHLRDMEKQQAQAEANQKYEITKALVRPKKKDEQDIDIEQAIGFNKISPYL